MAQDLRNGQGSSPVDRLKSEVGGLAAALGDRALSSVREKVEDTSGRLSDYVEGGAGPGLMTAVTGAKGMAEGKGPVRSLLGAGVKGATEKVRNRFGGRGGKGKNLKVTNIVESIDVGAPLQLAYNQWTRFTDFPSFMKKVENAEQAGDPKLNWKAQVFWSHRTWEATILKQVPDEQIIWRSKGPKGHVDGAVTFHELAPNLTRILLVLEYHPQGLFERTGNLWRAQGRRARLELKHFRRHVMAEALLNPDEVKGWRGVIEDGEVVQEDDAAHSGEQDDRTAPGDGGPDSEPAGEQYADDAYTDEENPDEEESGDYADDENPDDEYTQDGNPGDEYADDGNSGDEYADDQDQDERSSPEEDRSPRQRPVRRRTGSRGGMR